jgi:hypothetical protein
VTDAFETGDPSNDRKFGPGGPDSDRHSDATTNLSVAAYTDPEFRDRVLNDICSRRDRALAPSPGVDTALVSRHARRARSSDGFAMLAMWAYLTWRVDDATAEERLNLFLSLGVWLIAAWALHRAATGLQSTVHFTAAKLMTRMDIAILAALVLLAWAAVEIWSRCFGLGWRFELPVADLLAVGAIGLGMALYRAVRLLRILVKRNPWTLWSPRADSLERTQRSEIVIHPDNKESRFIGFGEERPGREIPLPLVDEQGRPRPAPDPEALIDAVRRRIGSLAYTAPNPCAKAHLEIFEQVHLWDSQVTRPVYRLEQWKADRPRLWWLRFWRPVSPRFAGFAEVRADPDWSQHVYLRFQISQERGEQIANVFFRCEVKADTLYIEFRTHHLYRTKPRYHLFRGGRAKRVKIVASSVILGYLTAPLLVPQGLVSLRRTTWHWWKRTRGWLGRNLRSGHVDCGPPKGLREMGSDPEPPQRQRSESEQMALIVTRNCLEALQEHLRGTIDVTDLNGHIGKVAKEIKVVVNEYRVKTEAGGVTNVGAIGTDAQADVGAMGEESRGSVHRTVANGDPEKLRRRWGRAGRTRWGRPVPPRNSPAPAADGAATDPAQRVSADASASSAETSRTGPVVAPTTALTVSDFARATNTDATDATVTSAAVTCSAGISKTTATGNRCTPTTNAIHADIRSARLRQASRPAPSPAAANSMPTMMPKTGPVLSSMTEPSDQCRHTSRPPATAVRPLRIEPIRRGHSQDAGGFSCAQPNQDMAKKPKTAAMPAASRRCSGLKGMPI